MGACQSSSRSDDDVAHRHHLHAGRPTSIVPNQTNHHSGASHHRPLPDRNVSSVDATSEDGGLDHIVMHVGFVERTASSSSHSSHSQDASNPVTSSKAPRGGAADLSPTATTSPRRRDAVGVRKILVPAKVDDEEGPPELGQSTNPLQPDNHSSDADGPLGSSNSHMSATGLAANGTMLVENLHMPEFQQPLCPSTGLFEVIQCGSSVSTMDHFASLKSLHGSQHSSHGQQQPGHQNWVQSATGIEVANVLAGRLTQQ